MSLQSSDGEFSFARALVDPNKKIRDEMLGNVNSFVSNLNKIDDLEMLKLWKALYYCMWLCDKPEIQSELAIALSNMAELFKNQKLSLLYIRMFYKTILREWSTLDQYRVDKFYALVRVFTNKSLQLAAAHGWKSDFTSELCQIIENEVLLRRPNGIRFHMVDIFLPELIKVSGENTDADTFVNLVDMFLRCLLRQDDSVFLDRVANGLFRMYLTDYAGENAAEMVEATHDLFPVSVTIAMQKKLFDTAADEKTPDFARRRLYAIHKEFGQKSGHAFITDDTISAAKVSSKSGSSSKSSKKAAAPSSLTAESKTGKSKSVDKAPSTSHAKLTAVEDASSGSKRKRVKESALEEQKTVVESVPAASAVAAAAAADISSSAAKKKSKKQSPSVDEASRDAEPVAALPAGVPVKSALKKSVAKAVESTDSAAQVAADAPFLPSAKFAGRKVGYVFHKGASGVGYYLDHPPKAAAKKSKVQISAPAPASRKNGRR